MKRHGGDDSYEGGRSSMSGKRQRPDSYTEAITAGKYELRLLISSRNAGGIIGKGGSNIKRLRSEFDATLTVPDSQTPERVLTVMASVDNVFNCVGDIIPRLDEFQTRNGDNRRRDGEVRILVHSSHAGAVIGRGGSKIKEIREETGTHLKVYARCCPQSTERVIQITGNPDRILECIKVIVNLLKEIPLKGSSRPYESLFYDPAFAVEYGGFPPDRNYREPPRSSMSINAGLPSYAGEMSVRSARNFPNRAPMTSGAIPPFSPDLKQTTQVTIPNELGGTIIGKGGERISRIREESGASITIEPPQEDKERIITISGSPAQIQTAQYLLQQCVRSSIAGRRYLSQH